MSAPLQQKPAGTLPRFETLWLDRTNDNSLTCAAPRTTRAEFRSRVDSLAEQLAGLHHPVLLACNSTLHFAIGFCAALRAGREILLPPNLQPETLTDAAFMNAELLDDACISRRYPPATLPQATFNPEHPVTLFTSGSTGTPKRIRKTLRQLSAEIDTLEAAFGEILQAAHIVATVPHIHIYGALFRVLWPLATGRTFADNALSAGRTESLDAAALVSSPAFLRRIGPGTFSDATPRVIFSSGGKLAEDEAARIPLVAGCPLIEVYGSTESGGIAWRKWSGERGSTGEWTPFDGVQLRVNSEDGRLQVCSSATGETWLDSGDAVEAHANGRFTLLGRADGIIKLEDKRVSLPAIGNWLEKHTWVAEARVIELHGHRTELGAVLRFNATGRSALGEQTRRAVTQQLREHVQRKFEAVTTPRKWRFVDELPVNAMGKTTRAELVALFARGTT